MKRNYRNLFMVGMMAIAACFTGCKEKDAPFFAASIAGNEQIAEEISAQLLLHSHSKPRTLRLLLTS